MSASLNHAVPVYHQYSIQSSAMQGQSVEQSGGQIWLWVLGSDHILAVPTFPCTGTAEHY